LFISKIALKAVYVRVYLYVIASDITRSLIVSLCDGKRPELGWRQQLLTGFAIVNHPQADSATCTTLHRQLPSMWSCCSTCMEQSATRRPFHDFSEHLQETS